MAEYSSWKVADLKAELKKRGIPQTGLRLKQQFIDKLSEEDAKAQLQDTAAAPAESLPTETSQEDNIAQNNENHELARSPAKEPEEPSSITVPAQSSNSPETPAVLEQDQPQSPGLKSHNDENPGTSATMPVEQPVLHETPQSEPNKPASTLTERVTAAETDQVSKEPAATTEPNPSNTLSERAIADETEQGPNEQADDTTTNLSAVHAQEPTTAEDEQALQETATSTEDTPSKTLAEHTPAAETEQVPDEPTATTEHAPSAILTSGENTGLSTPLPVEELLEDKRKRKRRSQSPLPTPEAIAQKKARAQEDTPRVTLKDDLPNEVNPAELTETESSQVAVSIKEAPVPPKQDARFRGLFATDTAHPPPPRVASPTEDVDMKDATVTPAIHPATCSLYIDGLMRPLKPNDLRNYLVSLASTAQQDADPDVIQVFWLDPIKTHCFVQFINIAAASRARAALHGAVWPNERNRKNLWADFIPDEQIQTWIQTEMSAQGRPGSPPRWEVRYETKNEGIVASLVEAGSNARMNASRAHELGFDRPPPSGPRASFAQPERRPSRVEAPAPAQTGQGFKPLDELFQSTTTKPKLYYLRVPREVADKRLDQFDELIRKGQFPRRGGDEMRRITFEEQDQFVDVGPEYGPGALRRGRGGGPGGRGGRRGGDGRWR